MSIKPFSADDCANALLWIAPQLAATHTERELVRCLAALLFANQCAYEERYGAIDRAKYVAHEDVLDCDRAIRGELRRRRSNAAVEKRPPYVDVERARNAWRTIGGNLDAGTDQLHLLADGPAADKLLRVAWPLARREDEYLCGCGCVFFEASVPRGARTGKSGFGTCEDCAKGIALQRTILARPLEKHTGFGIIGRLWHTLRRSSLGIRFAPTADLDEQTVDGLRWQPVVAVMPAQRAREILRQARERATIGLWSDQIDKVATAAEIAAINAVWEDMPGHTRFVVALERIAGGK
jgi:hypothetical protein